MLQIFHLILFTILPFSFPVILPSFNDFIQLIISIIDAIAIAIVIISIIQAIKPFLMYSIRATFRSFDQTSIENTNDDASNDTSRDTQPKKLLIGSRYNSSKKSFVNGLLFALELESANAILKMGLFTASSVGLNSMLLQTQTPISVLGGNFLFFVLVLAVRIAINQTLHRFS